jgi:hypothetical protein
MHARHRINQCRQFAHIIFTKNIQKIDNELNGKCLQCVITENNTSVESQQSQKQSNELTHWSTQASMDTRRLAGWIRLDQQLISSSETEEARCLVALRY